MSEHIIYHIADGIATVPTLEPSQGAQCYQL